MNLLGLADRLNLRRSGNSWRGACPVCGYAAESFALTTKAGRVRGWCASCGDRERIAAALMAIEGGQAIGRSANPKAKAPLPDPGQRTAAAVSIWNGAVPVKGTPAQLYLTNRALPNLAASSSLRWRPDVAHPSGGGGRFPAMIGLVVDVEGKPVAVHRTFLERDGRKADLTPVKASKGPVAGGAIRLDPAGSELVVAEGIESAASAGVLLNLPAWSAVSAGNMAATLILPPEVRKITIAADRDGPGQRAARDASVRWRAEGRKVRIVAPDRAGSDFNDLLVERARAGR